MWYCGDREIDLKDFFCELLEERRDWMEERVGVMLDECYEPWRFGAIVTFYPSRIVKECKPNLWEDLISDETDYVISDWFYSLDIANIEDGTTLYDLLQEWDFENEMSKVVWKDLV